MAARTTTGKAAGGFTIMEILIAMVILLVGVCGVLALFPVAIRATRQSCEDTLSSIIAESVGSALVQAMRLAPLPASPGTPVRVRFVHDGCPAQGDDNWYYVFDLPTVVGSPVSCPRLGQGTDATLRVFRLGWDPISPPADVSDNVRQTSDPTIEYDQYAFSFDVTRVESRPLFEFRIDIYRNYRDATGTFDPSTQRHPSFVKEFTTLIYGK
jgi:hypothetical protein